MKVYISILVLTAIALNSCGFKVEEEIDGEAEITVRLEVAFPECARIEDDELMIECIKAASQITISIDGELSQDQIDILDDLGIDDSEIGALD